MTPEPLSVRPLQWSALPDLEAAPPIGPDDMACLHELRDVLARHGKLDRFAVHLAHRHFILGDGEILIERPDPDGRTQHVTVGRREDAPDAIPTTWLFQDGPELRLSEATFCVCQPGSAVSSGCSKHGKSQAPTPLHQKEEAIRQRRIQREKAERESGGRGRDD